MLVNISPGDDSSGGTRVTVEGRADTAIGIAVENGDVRGGRKRERARGGQGFTRANLNALYTSSTL